MTKNWLSFKRQEDGSYLFDEDGLKICYSENGLLKCEKNGQLVFEKQYQTSTKAMLNAVEVYGKFK